MLCVGWVTKKRILAFSHASFHSLFFSLLLSLIHAPSISCVSGARFIFGAHHAGSAGFTLSVATTRRAAGVIALVHYHCFTSLPAEAFGDTLSTSLSLLDDYAGWVSAACFS